MFPQWHQNTLRQNVKKLDADGFSLLEVLFIVVFTKSYSISNVLILFLLQKMFIYDPAIRISAKDAVNHDYFKDIDLSILPARPYSP